MDGDPSTLANLSRMSIVLMSGIVGLVSSVSSANLSNGARLLGPSKTDSPGWVGLPHWSIPVQSAVRCRGAA